MTTLLLIIPAALILAIVVGIYYIKCQARALSRQLFRTDTLVQGYRQQKELLSETPKSVSGMTRIYLPQIARDFPEFHYEEFKHRAEQMLCSAFLAISQENDRLLEHASLDLQKSIALHISSNQSERQREFYERITIHQTEISGYKKVGGTCTITLQSAVGHLHWIEREGQVVAGDKALKKQCKYNIEIVYIQDASQLAGDQQTAFSSAVCPNCGAPIESTGSKLCAYCGSGIQTVNIRVWHINQYKKI